MKTSSDGSAQSPVDVEKEGAGAHVEAIHTNERVPGHNNYYEKDGLRWSSSVFDVVQWHDIDISESQAHMSMEKTMNMSHRYSIQPVLLSKN